MVIERVAARLAQLHLAAADRLGDVVQRRGGDQEPGAAGRHGEGVAAVGGGENAAQPQVCVLHRGIDDGPSRASLGDLAVQQQAARHLDYHLLPDRALRPVELRGTYEVRLAVRRDGRDETGAAGDRADLEAPVHPSYHPLCRRRWCSPLPVWCRY